MAPSLTQYTHPAAVQPPTGVVVLLHGWGGSTDDLLTIARYLRLSTIEFQVPCSPFPHPYNPMGRMWYGLPDRYSFSQEDAAELGPDLATSRQLLTDWMEGLPQQTGVPLSRTMLGGFSQGGSMALDVGLSLPLAGIMVMSGFLHHAPTHPPAMPILMVHGRQDPVVPIACARHAQAVMQGMGATVTYQELDMGHEIDPNALDCLREFVRSTLG